MGARSWLWTGSASRLAVATALAGWMWSSIAQAKDFWAFESGHVRPLALSADRSRLYAVNTPDNRLEVFHVGEAGLAHLSSVTVGMEPVALALRDDSEVWVVNHLSDSVSVVDVSTEPPRVLRTLLVGDEPRDIVFAGPDRRHAYVSTARRGQNAVANGVDPRLRDPAVATGAEPWERSPGRALIWVFDAEDLGSSLEGSPLTVLELFGDTPRALAASSDGSRVWAAIHHSGNQTSALLQPAIASLGGAIPPSQPTTNDPQADPNDPAGSGVPRPEVGTIVRLVGGQWLDDEGRDFTPFMRLHLPDLDVFEIDATASPSVVNAFPGVGTILFNMAINPVTGKLYVSNTEANNLQRFEGPSDFCATLPPGTCSTLRGHLHEARITVIDPNSADPATAATPQHLNKHLVPYTRFEASDGDRARSLATPLGMAVTQNGATAYVTAFGSSKVGVFSAAQLEAGTFDPNAASHIELSEGGPSGIVLDEPRQRAYVFTRFGNSITIVDTSTAPGAELGVVSLPHDPEPPAIRQGRRFLYDARLTSSNGEASCAGCHVFADLDSLGWNLGDPDGVDVANPNPFVPASTVPNPRFHPMKGPMTTQSLRGLANHGPMHWRGDRTGGSTGGDPLSEFEAFVAFNVAFEGLLGRGSPLDPNDMAAFANFILEVEYPPNPIRHLDNSDRFQDGTAVGAGREIYNGTFTGIPPDPNDPNDPGLPGSPSDGSDGQTCNACHTLDEAASFFGTAGLSAFDAETQEFKVPHLRNMYQKVGMFGIGVFGEVPPFPNTHFGDQVRGFGYGHDGGFDTLKSFVRSPVFNFTGTTAQQERKRELLADFMLAFPTALAPAVGQQVTLTAGNGDVALPRIALLRARANPSGPAECDLIAKGWIDGEPRGWAQTGADAFTPDRDGAAPLDDAALRALVDEPGETLTYTCAPPGSGTRMGLDRDLAGPRDGSQCGDVNGDGVFRAADVQRARLALAGLDPGLAVPRKCNVLGPPNPADADGDAVPDDCAIDDIAFMLRAVSGAALPAGGVCELPLP